MTTVMSISTSPTANLSTAALSAHADKASDDSAREDMKGARSARNRKIAALKARLDKLATERKKVADQRLKASKKKAGGMFSGGLVGLVGALCLFIPGLQIVGAICLAFQAAGAIANGAAQKSATKNEAKAAELEKEISSVEKEIKDLEKEEGDAHDKMREAAKAQEQVFADARKRDTEYNRALAG